MNRLRVVMRSALALLLLAVLLGGCGVASSGTIVTPATQVDARYVGANTRFGLAVFAHLREQKPRENLFVSPASISLILSLLNNGASGETQQAIARTLQQQGMTMEEVNEASAALQSILTNPDPQVQLQVANSIWVQKGVSLNAAFAQAGRTYYNAEVRNLDFGKASAAKTINSWVASATHDKINSIIDQTTPDMLSILVNAIYFNGTWTHKFDPAQTQPHAFTLSGGTTKQVQMMRADGRFRYLQGDGFQAVSLPYGQERLSLYVLLPDAGTDLESFYQKLTAANWESWMGDFASRPGTVMLPRTRVEYNAKLNETLEALGMGIAFDGKRADFSRLFDGGKKAEISAVVHKTYLDINEKGTEAAAVTATIMTTSAAPQPAEPFMMVVDHPFFVAIRDNRTGMLLFMGSIMNP